MPASVECKETRFDAANSVSVLSLNQVGRHSLCHANGSHIIPACCARLCSFIQPTLQARRVLVQNQLRAINRQQTDLAMLHEICRVVAALFLKLCALNSDACRSGGEADCRLTKFTSSVGKLNTKLLISGLEKGQKVVCSRLKAGVSLARRENGDDDTHCDL